MLLPDWNDRWAALHPGLPRCGRRDLRTFLSEPMRHGLHPLSWHMLAQWMRVHQDALVIADAKTRTLHILGEMAQQRDLVPKVIPQIFGLREYRHVRALGYDRIFLTLYRRDYLTSALISFVRTCPVAAVVCTPERARRSGLARRLGLEGVPVFVHTVNSHEQHERSRGDGAWGIYTDSLLP